MFALPGPTLVVTQGDTVTVTLVFEKAGPVTIEAVVRAG